MSKPLINWKRALGESTFVTASWNWFMLFTGKAAEPVLVVSVLYASVKRLPVVHFPPQFDGAVFIAHFVALDIGGLSFNTLADQAKKDGHGEISEQAKRLSIALVIMADRNPDRHTNGNTSRFRSRPRRYARLPKQHCTTTSWSPTD